jgi:hypothetical protein
MRAWVARAIPIEWEKSNCREMGQYRLREIVGSDSFLPQTKKIREDWRRRMLRMVMVRVVLAVMMMMLMLMMMMLIRDDPRQ